MSERPWPALTPDSERFYRGASSGRLLIERCRICFKFRHYPGGGCPYCGSFEKEWEAVGGDGELYTYVVVHRSPFKFFQDRIPFLIGLVELSAAPGVRLLANVLCSPDDAAIGMRLVPAFEHVNAEYAVPAFIPSGRDDAAL